MKNILIVGATSGVGESLFNRLSSDHELWTASRTASKAQAKRHLIWDAESDPFPAAGLPERLGGLVYCPGSINLLPIERLDVEALRRDLELNLVAAIKVMSGGAACFSPFRKRVLDHRPNPPCGQQPGLSAPLFLTT